MQRRAITLDAGAVKRQPLRFVLESEVSTLARWRPHGVRPKGCGPGLTYLSNELLFFVGTEGPMSSCTSSYHPNGRKVLFQSLCQFLGHSTSCALKLTGVSSEFC